MSELTIVKVGTGVVSNQERTQLDRDTIESIGYDIAQIENHAHIDDIGTEQAQRNDHKGSVILVSSGAVTAGKEKLRLDSRAFENTRMQQLAAMTGNIALCSLWEEATGMVVAHDLPTHNDLLDAEHWNNLTGAIATALEFGVLPVLNEGDARSTEELQKTIRTNGREFKRFGDNDQLTARLALQLGRFALDFSGQNTRVIFLTDVNGVREDASNADSVIEYLHVDDINQVILDCVNDTGVSNGGMLSKLLAAKDLASAGISVSIGAGKGEVSLMDLYNYEAGAGTHILASDRFDMVATEWDDVARF